MSHRLLTRTEFRDAVLARSKGRCVVCGDVATDAHHILDRSLWSDGGYYLANGAAVCEKCHLACELTEVSVQGIRSLAGITDPIVPPTIDAGAVVDKWGNELTKDGRVFLGPLGETPAVIEALRSVGRLDHVSERRKYPRTPHLPFSRSSTDDDIHAANLSAFVGRRVVCLEKVDGENTTIYPDGSCHARSLNSGFHESRTYVRQLAARVGPGLGAGMRLCGENMYAVHSIAYDSLPDWFLAFSVWSGSTCLSWDDTVEWAALLDVCLVPVLYDGMFDEAALRAVCSDTRDGRSQEGVVVRLADEFQMSEFGRSVAKWVRPKHVTTGTHWMSGPVVPNGRI